jgi:hypothetical protein
MVLAAALLRFQVFSDLTLCDWVRNSEHLSLTLKKKEAPCFFETHGTTLPVTQLHSPKDLELHIQTCSYCPYQNIHLTHVFIYNFDTELSDDDHLLVGTYWSTEVYFQLTYKPLLFDGLMHFINVMEEQAEGM